jgi:hypothetical protein
MTYPALMSTRVQLGCNACILSAATVDIHGSCHATTMNNTSIHEGKHQYRQ